MKSKVDLSIVELPRQPEQFQYRYILETRCGKCSKLQPDKRGITTPSHTAVYAYTKNGVLKTTQTSVECMFFKCLRHKQLAFVGAQFAKDCLTFEA